MDTLVIVYIYDVIYNRTLNKIMQQDMCIHMSYTKGKMYIYDENMPWNHDSKRCLTNAESIISENGFLLGVE